MPPILFLNCSSHVDNSFELLANSFYIWYYSNHPTLATLHNFGDYNGTFKANDFKANEQYTIDLNRFYFELTQINMQKLNKINKIKYNRIQKTMQKLIYLKENIKEEEWKPSIKLNEIENGINYLINYNYISEDNRMKAIKGRLLEIDKILKNILINIVFISDLEYLNCVIKVNSIIKLLNNIEINLEYNDRNYNTNHLLNIRFSYFICSIKKFK